MIDLGKLELEGLLRFNKGTIVLYIYTPFCGTCKVTSKMLEVALEALPTMRVYQCNINRIPTIAAEWKITSVPSLVIINKNHIVDKVYALKSVDHIYDILKSLQNT
jgi:thioredoxin-like negative regulator of GroEL